MAKKDIREVLEDREFTIVEATPWHILLKSEEEYFKVEYMDDVGLVYYQFKAEALNYGA